MNIWLISDTHYNDKSIIEYCNRPVNFEQLIFRALKRNIKKNDICIHLGDFCYGNDKEMHDRYLLSLKNGKYYLIRGNHDQKSGQWYKRHGWSKVVNRLTFDYCGKRIIFSHAPIKLSDKNIINIHGHFHNKIWPAHLTKYKKIINQQHRLLVLENLKYQPIKLAVFLRKKRFNIC